jgi:uncharacterized protein YcfJ
MGFLACNSGSSVRPIDKDTISPWDTAGLYHYNLHKSQNELDGVVVPPPPPRPIMKTQTQTKTVYRDRVVEKQVPVAQQKKGWSNKAKGAVIGGVAGAGAGAVINKKDRVKGAVIGGVVGAGAGVIIGNEKDKKQGRN